MKMFLVGSYFNRRYFVAVIEPLLALLMYPHYTLVAVLSTFCTSETKLLVRSMLDCVCG